MVGCHSEMFVSKILKKIKKGHLFAFEPDPALYQKLLKKYADHPLVHLYPSAPDQISIAKGLQQHVPGYLEIDILYLSDFIDPDTILNKCEKLLNRERMYVIFSLKRSDENIHRKIFYTLTSEYAMHLYTTQKWLKGKSPMDEASLLKALSKGRRHMVGYRKKVSHEQD